MPAPIRINVSGQQRRALSRTRSQTKSTLLWRPITAILMLATAMSAQDIAPVLSVNLDTLTYWRRRWLEGGLFRLNEAPRSGRPGQAKES